MAVFTDTHSHIYDEAFAEDREAALSRCAAAGVTRLVLPGINAAAYAPMCECADAHPGMMFPCIGLHPTEINETWEAEMVFLRAHLHERKFYAIGEIGLDEYWSTEFLDLQKRLFAEQVEIAAQEDLPIIIHSREATEDVFRVLEEVKGLPVRGVFHAYSGSYETYKRCLQYGDFKFGIGGVLTYKKAGIAEVVTRMSPDDLILETDCPWLTPVPHRGERNESSYIPLVAEKLSALTGIPLETIAERTTATAEKLFGLNKIQQ